jgi:hypothetical protein
LVAKNHSQDEGCRENRHEKCPGQPRLEAPGTGVVIDPSSPGGRALYVIVPTGGRPP